MIGGFILGGDANSQIEIFGIGPSLAASGVSGVLADPTLELRDSNGALLASNDNCGAISIHPLDPAEACIDSLASTRPFHCHPGWKERRHRNRSPRNLQ